MLTSESCPYTSKHQERRADGEATGESASQARSAPDARYEGQGTDRGQRGEQGTAYALHPTVPALVRTGHAGIMARSWNRWHYKPSVAEHQIKASILSAQHGCYSRPRTQTSQTDAMRGA